LARPRVSLPARDRRDRLDRHVLLLRRARQPSPPCRRPGRPHGRVVGDPRRWLLPHREVPRHAADDPGAAALVQVGGVHDVAAGARGKQRSVHNNYLTLPVLFAMLSNHFAFTYTHEDAWLILVWFMVIGVAIRHFFNLRHQGRNVWAIPVVCALSLVGIAIWL